MFELLIVLSSFFTPVTLPQAKPATVEQISSGTEVIKMRIDSEKVSCGDDDNATCYRVQKGASIGKDNWEVLPQSIAGFNYEAGYIYDIVVRISLDDSKTGKDRFHYELEHVVSKIKA